MPQPLKLMRSSSSVLLVCCQMHALLHDDPNGVVLEVEQVLCIQGSPDSKSGEAR
jgi:hypothetical protein